MFASFEVQACSGSYQIQIKSHGFEAFLRDAGTDNLLNNLAEHRLMLADSFFESRLLAAGHTAILAPAAETTKSLEAVPRLVEALRTSGAGRHTHLVAIGGGILQDISAFIASIYMRGLTWSYLPTTVLAMVDSCIGGKSSINVGEYKNLVGTFHPPQRVLIDPALIATLPLHEQASGLVEAAKICFCRGPETFARYLACHPQPTMPTEMMEQVIFESLAAKKWFIEVDEFDKKERLLLNFGHTFGHAIEGASHYMIGHGIAIGLGILCALEFQRQRGINDSLGAQITPLAEHLHALVLTAPRLAEHLQALLPDELLRRFESDKKHTRSHYTIILVNESGEVQLERIPRTEESRMRVQGAFEKVAKRFV